jgi:hypothetical protein
VTGKTSDGLLVAPKGTGGTRLLLARASNEEEASHTGNQAGGRVFLFLHTDDFCRDYKAMTTRGVKFLDNRERSHTAQ